MAVPDIAAVAGFPGVDSMGRKDPKTVVWAGNTASRPALTSVPVGFSFYDSQINKPIWKKDDTHWVDATGADVA